MESLLLSVAHFRSRKDTGDRIVKPPERHFRQDEKYWAQKEEGRAAHLGRKPL
jgi:hypothetical protein